MAAEPAWVEAVGLTKRYGGVLALERASLNVRHGEIRGVVGANGAGKSTLVKCLTGLVRPTAGLVHVDGRPLALGRPADALRNGIVSVPQEMTVAPTMTVAENLMLGHEVHSRFGRVRGRETRHAAQAVLDSLAFDIRLDEKVGQLSLLEQRLVMIARALSWKPRLAIFDEPTATLSPVEAQRLLESIRSLASQGVSVLYVSHHLAEVEDLCDAVTVLRDGRVVAELSGAGATHRALVELLAPVEAREAPVREVPGTRVVLEARELTGERLRGVSVRAHEGEVVGLAGLAGSGARELLLTVCGAVPFTSGSLELFARPLRPGSTSRAVAAGVGFLPGDRSLGSLAGHSIRHNVGLPALVRHARAYIVDRRAERRTVAAALERVDLRADQERPIASLSGGNQQKALVARWIASRARLLLLDDPTAGVDVATRPEIHDQIRSLAAAGAGVLLVSTDVQELADLSHRVVVFSRGTTVGELSGQDLTPGNVLAAMTGRPSTTRRHT